MPKTTDNITFDRALRSYDHDGRLRVELTNLSKSNVCPYYGHEIPVPGLAPETIYYLWRHPEELRLAADTSNNIPLLEEHVGVTPGDPHKNSVVGSTGTDAMIENDYLKNSLVVWEKSAIDKIEAGVKKQLSCGYYYEADMTPGEIQGVKYDGIMRNIRFNHVALVPEGRAGSDVMVADSMPLQISNIEENTPMSKLKTAVDASEKDEAEDEDMDELKAKGSDEDMDEMEKADAEKDVKVKAKDKSAKDKAARDKAAKDKAAKDKAKDEDMDEEGAMDEDDDEDEKKSEKAMDAAMRKIAKDEIRSELMAEMRALREAEDLVRPVMGRLNGMDSANGVYKHFLKSRGIATAGLHSSALKPLAKMAVDSALKETATKPVMATDQSSIDSFASNFPIAARVRFEQMR